MSPKLTPPPSRFTRPTSAAELFRTNPALAQKWGAWLKVNRPALKALLVGRLTTP
jgi:hypothetical protein